MMRSLLAITVILLSSLLTACLPGSNEFSGFVPIDDKGWAYGDSIMFTPAITDSIATGKLKVAVCHNNDYAYSNLWLEVSFPMGDIIERDTVQLVLADKYGHWQGKGLGSQLQCEVKLPGKLRVHRDTRVGIRHIMRVDTLRDIKLIGLTFDPE